MRIIYFDIDTLRADHLGCYGYGRPTSPTIDAVAADGVRFTNVYASDLPCLPSRTALSSGRLGIHNGVAGHGGTAAAPFPEGRERGFRSRDAAETWASQMQAVGLWTASISTFPERHSAYHFLAGFHESYNLGTRGLETADQVAEVAVEWLGRNGGRPDWFLHVHMWDPHTPYRTPESFGEPFAGMPAPAWLDEDVRAHHWSLPGPHSAQEITGFGPRPHWQGYPRQPLVAGDMAQVQRMFDGYDTGVRYVDHYIGVVLGHLARLGMEDDVAVIISADHGETLGELGIYCDHQTADHHVARVPMIIRWPGLEAGVDDSLHYQVDVAATVLELSGGTVPERWDGRSFRASLDAHEYAGRESLVLTQGAWTAQRAVRFADWIFIRTFHDSYHGFPDTMLFDLKGDPHEQHDLSEQRSDVTTKATDLLEEWRCTAIGRSPDAVDPLDTVLAEGDPWHARWRPAEYDEWLEQTGRASWVSRAAVAD
jgi:arylsulfatase A-like enzyme